MSAHRTLDIGGLFFGGTALVVGAFYTLRNTFGLPLGDLSWDLIWPVLVLGLGVSVLYGAVAKSRREGRPQ